MSDLKLVFLVALMCLVFYWVYRWMSSNDTRPIYGSPRMPSITFKSSPAPKTSEPPPKERQGK
jgi:hypothetical protein